MPLAEARRSGTFRHPDLAETSGVVPSGSQSGILWTVADSDGPSRIFATDTVGRDRGNFLLRGASNVDWEAITAGRCGAATCLYVADTGDNLETRRSVRIYRLEEPVVASAGGKGAAISHIETLEVRYPDEPRDVEAAFVDGRGDLHLLSKGRTAGFLHYRVPASAWSGSTAVAQRLGVLALGGGGGLGRLVTDAALGPDGKLVAVRTYQEIFLFHLTERGHLRPTGLACSLGGLELQGEGIAWLDDATLVLTSEGALGLPGSVSIGRCAGA